MYDCNSSIKRLWGVLIVELELLVKCSVDMLEILVKLYEAGKLDFKSFKENAQVKIRFLADNKSDIHSAKEKTRAESIVIKCEEILSKYCNC